MYQILGFGGYVPERVMTNDDWAEIVDTSDDWIRERTGIERRRVAAPDQATVDLAAEAAIVAMKDAGLGPDDIDEIIVATDTQQARTPDTASYLQHRLGAGPIPAFDLGGSGCAGFVQALDVARARITLDPKRVLVVGVEVLLRVLSWRDRNTCVLFGDGAGAVVVGPGEGNPQILDVIAGTDGSKTGILVSTAGGTSDPFTREQLEAGLHDKLVMEGRAVFREAVHHMTDSVNELLDRLGKQIDDVSLLVPHQANKRIIDAVGQRLGIDADRVMINVNEYGNTGSASVPLALWEARNAGRISPGDLVILTAFGAGFHWASAAVQF